MALLNKNECEKYVSSFIDMIDYRQSNKTFKHITRNNDYWKMINYIMLDYYTGKNTSEYELIKKLNCSTMTANNYIYDLVKNFNSYYQSTTILVHNDSVRSLRLSICDKVGHIIKNSMGLLGIDVPERM